MLTFLQPILDFDYDKPYFARLATKLANQTTYPEKETLIRTNAEMIERMKEMAGDSIEDPFRLVKEDLE